MTAAKPETAFFLPRCELRSRKIADAAAQRTAQGALWQGVKAAADLSADLLRAVLLRATSKSCSLTALEKGAHDAGAQCKAQGALRQVDGLLAQLQGCREALCQECSSHTQPAHSAQCLC